MVKHPIGNTVRKIERAGVKISKKPAVRRAVRNIKKAGNAAAKTGGKLASQAGRATQKFVRSAGQTGGEVAAEVGESGGKMDRKAGRAIRQFVKAV